MVTVPFRTWQVWKFFLRFNIGVANEYLCMRKLCVQTVEHLFFLTLQYFNSKDTDLPAILINIQCINSQPVTQICHKIYCSRKFRLFIYWQYFPNTELFILSLQKKKILLIIISLLMTCSHMRILMLQYISILLKTITLIYSM